ncbi:MAG: 3-dehydroquinate synthase [Candidatus Aenigmarchaeota archaeon]|nr:3-dehydroquinate synthase [Candidatus Aenigmarchaeota archaeon]
MVELRDNVMRLTLKREVDESYDIVFGYEMFPQIAGNLRSSPIGSRYAIITDSNVGPLYAEGLEESLRSEGLKADTFSFEAGEENKTLDSCESLVRALVRSGYGRDSAILALGGGVVGDAAGFVAAVYNRGIPYVQIPTTVLAQADSSVGGKTAVDTEYGKNLIGAFKQPERVYIDVATLRTLPERQYRAGLAETIKHGVIQDADFFRYLEENMHIVLQRSPESSLHIAKNNCRIKGNVVEIDPHEKSLRRILNYGHTVGHALERLSGYELFHGEAVSIGMMVAGRISNELGYFPEEDLECQERLLTAAGLPTKIPPSMTDGSIIAASSSDKKAKDSRVRYVLPVSIGRMHDFDGEYAGYVDDKVVIEALRRTRQ